MDRESERMKKSRETVDGMLRSLGARSVVEKGSVRNLDVEPEPAPTKAINFWACGHCTGTNSIKDDQCGNCGYVRDSKPLTMRVIEAARRGLIDRGFRCLSGGEFGLPSYTDVEAWVGASGAVLYLVFDRETGGWDVLATLDQTNNVEATRAAVEEFAKSR